MEFGGETSPLLLEGPEAAPLAVFLMHGTYGMEGVDGHPLLQGLWRGRRIEPAPMPALVARQSGARSHDR